MGLFVRETVRIQLRCKW